MLVAHQLGAAAGAQQIISAGGTAAPAVLTAVGAATWAIPVVGAGVAAAMIAISILSRRGKQRIAATELVNQLEPILRQNLEGFLAGPRTRESQTAALQVFDDAMSWLQSANACGNPDLGGAGRACISDRDRGGLWDWYAYYRDPIERAELVASADPLKLIASASSPNLGILAGLALLAGALALGGIK